MKRTIRFTVFLIFCTILAFAGNNFSVETLKSVEKTEKKNSLEADQGVYEFEVCVSVRNCNGKYMAFCSVDCTVVAATACATSQAIAECGGDASVKVVSRIRLGQCR